MTINLLSFSKKNNNNIIFSDDEADKICIKFIKDKDMILKIINNIDNKNDVIEISINKLDAIKALYNLISDKIGFDISKDNKYLLKLGNKYLTFMKQNLYIIIIMI